MPGIGLLARDDSTKALGGGIIQQHRNEVNAFVRHGHARLHGMTWRHTQRLGRPVDVELRSIASAATSGNAADARRLGRRFNSMCRWAHDCKRQIAGIGPRKVAIERIDAASAERRPRLHGAAPARAWSHHCVTSGDCSVVTMARSSCLQRRGQAILGFIPLGERRRLPSEMRRSTQGYVRSVADVPGRCLVALRPWLPATPPAARLGHP